MNIKHIMRTVNKVGKQFTKPDDDWVSIVLYEVNKKPYAAPLAIDPAQDRKGMIQELKEIWLKEQPSSMALVISAFVVRIKKDDPLYTIKMELCRELGPQYSPSREENIMVEFFDGKESQCCFARINRFSDKPPTLDKWGKIIKDLNIDEVNPKWLVREAYLLAQEEKGNAQ